MKKRLKIALNIGIWTLLVAYIFFAARYCRKQTDSLTCKRVDISILDSSKMGFITEPIVRNWIEGYKLKGRNISGINVSELKKDILSHLYVEQAKVYTTSAGVLNIDILQRTPVLRVVSTSGHDFYLDREMVVLPPQSHAFCDVPIITGNINLPFDAKFRGKLIKLSTDEKKVDKNYTFLAKLINFVLFIEQDSFWRSQIVQINVVNGDQVELIPRLGDHIVMLGDLSDYQQKMDKLLSFYKKAIGFDQFNSYRYLDLRFYGQVVCGK